MAACECGAKEQKADHIITSCPIYHHPNGAHALPDVKQQDNHRCQMTDNKGSFPKQSVVQQQLSASYLLKNCWQHGQVVRVPCS